MLTRLCAPRARNVIAAVLKRLAHRNANVQLYSLAVAEALSKNCGTEVHREIASRAFTQGLERIVTDRVYAATLLSYCTQHSDAAFRLATIKLRERRSP